MSSRPAHSLTLSDLQDSWLSVASLVLVLYDYLLTLDREIHYIWRRSVSSASILYLVLRYVSLAAVVVTMLNLFPFPGKASAGYEVGAVMRMMSLLTGDPQQMQRISVGRAGGILADLIVLILTWQRAWPVRVRGRVSHQFALTSVLFNDGTTYFSALLVANLMSLVFINNIQLVFVLIGWTSACVFRPFFALAALRLS
ncbi:uncharacterized protein BXZ73DRAFT_101821 [Epithele typhae]|uniref:uncharacterized protein n=1 Tax=Epithele typhae TaxID=378194 RepID=UPI0020084DEC|nr:uncharacterized protein BXZ73DRAFT_101821 [Epithele typhae]KAH9930447.1 hypothetical protein BXZ73DRAFT_101821 [Epithele typhae]